MKLKNKGKKFIAHLILYFTTVRMNALHILPVDITEWHRLFLYFLPMHFCYFALWMLIFKFDVHVLLGLGRMFSMFYHIHVLILYYSQKECAFFTNLLFLLVFSNPSHCVFSAFSVSYVECFAKCIVHL